jgi:D-tyrosyl-tRNA(Tyr) deacylase
VIGLLQRVLDARVVVDTKCVGEIGCGLMVLVGVERGDDEATARRLAEKLLAYRVFADSAGKMNRSLTDVAGGLLLVPQFTLPADTHKGLRPSFDPAAPPEEGHRLFDALAAHARSLHSPLATGVFGAHMQVTLTNDGPVTFWLRAVPGQAHRRKRP